MCVEGTTYHTKTRSKPGTELKTKRLVGEAKREPQCRTVVARTRTFSARNIKVWLHHGEELLLFWNSEVAARRILGIALEETLGYTLYDLKRVETNTLKTIPITCMMLGAYHSKLLQPSMRFEDHPVWTSPGGGACQLQQRGHEALRKRRGWTTIVHLLC